MKKLVIVFVLGLITLSFGTKAQVRVDSNGNATVKYGTFSTNNDAFLYLGDTNHYIKAKFGYGVTIGTGGSDIIKMPQYTGRVGINREPLYTLDVNGPVRADQTLYSSDLRFKRDIKDLSNSLLSLKQMKGVSYNFSEQKDSLYASLSKDGSTKRHFGFIAQDFQKIFPDLVYEDKSGYLSIDYVAVIPVLVEAIKEQQAQIEELKKQINKN